jgi:hypothetical protein
MFNLNNRLDSVYSLPIDFEFRVTDKTVVLDFWDRLTSFLVTNLSVSPEISEGALNA